MNGLRLLPVLAAFILLSGLLPPAAAGREASAQHFYLADGTQLQGELLRMDPQGLVLSTAFSDSLHVPLAQVAAVLLQAELADLPLTADPSFYLVDGTHLQGTLQRLDDRELVLTTSFSGDLRVPFDQVTAIVLRPELLDQDTPAASVAAPVSLGTGESPGGGRQEIPPGRGTLEITIKGGEIRSSVRYKNRSDYNRMKTLVTLHLRIYLDGKLIHAESDEKIEKDYRRDTWRVLRNTHRFPPVALPVAAGWHHLQVVVGNDLGLLEAGEEHSGLVSAELFVEDLAVMPDEKTRVVIEGKGSRIGYGTYKLSLLSSR